MHLSTLALAPRSPRTRLQAIAAAIAAALAAGHAAAQVAPASARFSFFDIGGVALPDGSTPNIFGVDIDAAGQVLGNAESPDYARNFIWRGGSLITPLPDFPGVDRAVATSFSGNLAVGYLRIPSGNTEARAVITWQDAQTPGFAIFSNGTSEVRGVNASGSIVGAMTLSGQNPQAFLLPGSSGALQVLATSSSIGGSARASSISDSGYVAGTVDDLPFLWRDGVTTVLPNPLGGPAFISQVAVNDMGRVVVTTAPAGTSRGWISHGNTFDALPTGARSQALDLNNGNLVVGTIDDRAAAWVGGSAPVDLTSAAASALPIGATLRFARAVNDKGQIAGSYTVDGGSSSRGFRLTQTDEVFTGVSGSSWDWTSSWSSPLGPQGSATVWVTPPSSRTLYGPVDTGRAGVLRVGAVGSAGGPVATLTMVGGLIELMGAADGTAQALVISSRGVVGGQGSFVSRSGQSMLNAGRIVAGDLSFDGGLLVSTGTIEGNGRLGAGSGLENRGVLRPTGAGQLLVDATVVNLGRIEAPAGARVELSGDLTNTGADGRVALSGGTLQAGWIGNEARIEATSGASQIFGPVDNGAGARVVVSGQGALTFWDAVRNSGEIRVSAGAVATFFGDVTLVPQGSLTGDGLKFFEAGYAIEGLRASGASDGGAVGFGPQARVVLKLGTGGHDRVAVQGGLSLGGTLVLGGFGTEPLQAGQRFDVLDWGALQGRFDGIDASGLLLAPDTLLDTSSLYVDGSLLVTAVPEPAGWLLFAAGLAAVAGRRARDARGAG